MLLSSMMIGASEGVLPGVAGRIKNLNFYFERDRVSYGYFA
jgi:hypothetical protein